MTTPTFVINDEATSEDLCHTISAKLRLISDIVQTMDPDGENTLLWGISDLASDCGDVAAELFHRLNDKVDAFHNVPKQEGDTQRH